MQFTLPIPKLFGTFPNADPRVLLMAAECLKIDNYSNIPNITGYIRSIKIIPELTLAFYRQHEHPPNPNQHHKQAGYQQTDFLHWLLIHPSMTHHSLISILQIQLTYYLGLPGTDSVDC